MNHFSYLSPIGTVLTFNFNEFNEFYWPEIEHDAKKNNFNMQTGFPFEL